MNTNGRRELAERLVRKAYVRSVLIGCRCGCHQRADRSFFYKGYQFPVCARCTGVFIGYLLTLPVYFLVGFRFIQCFCFAGIMLLDWLIQYCKIKESTNLRRLITGMCGGFGVFGIEILVFARLLDVVKTILQK